MRVPVLLVLALGVVLQLNACDESTARRAQTLEADLAPVLVVGDQAGEVKKKELAISGKDRLSMPNAEGWHCGDPPGASLEPVANVAWIELRNPTPQTLTLSVELEGLPDTSPWLFAYPAGRSPLEGCTTFARSRKLSGASSLVLVPRASAFLLADVGAATGVYTLSARTDDVLSTGGLRLSATEGEAATTSVAVSGRDRASPPSTADWRCGEPANGGSAASNVAWVELINPTQSTLGVDVSLDGLPDTYPDLFAYASRSAPLTDCRTFSSTRRLGGSSSVVVEPNVSAFVLVSAHAATGVYQLTATTQAIVEP